MQEYENGKGVPGWGERGPTSSIMKRGTLAAWLTGNSASVCKMGTISQAEAHVLNFSQCTWRRRSSAVGSALISSCTAPHCAASRERWSPYHSAPLRQSTPLAFSPRCPWRTRLLPSHSLMADHVRPHGPADLVLPTGVVAEETVDLLRNAAPPPHHDLERTLVDGVEDEELDAQERARLAAKPWWKRPSPWWCVAATGHDDVAYVETQAARYSVSGDHCGWRDDGTARRDPHYACLRSTQA